MEELTLKEEKIKAMIDSINQDDTIENKELSIIKTIALNMSFNS